MIRCPNLIARRREWERLIGAAFFHGDDIHLYHNMYHFIDFVEKDSHLEAIGSRFFGKVINWNPKWGLIDLLVCSHTCSLYHTA